MKTEQVVFAKKLILPSVAANVLQSLNMAYSFAQNGVQTMLLPGLRTGDRRQFQQVEKALSLSPSADLRVHCLYGGHKGLYGLVFRWTLLREWLSKDCVKFFYARDISEWEMIVRLKRHIPRPHCFFVEMHEILAEEHAQDGPEVCAKYRQREAAVLRHADGVVCTNTLLARKVRESYAPTIPMLVAPNGYNDKVFQPVPVVDFGGDITIAYFGSFHRGKGVEHLVDAMEFLPEHCRLLVMGGEPAATLKSLKERAACYGDRVHFTGFVNPQDIPRYLKECQLFVLPQDSDEFFSPIKLNEAMGAALPSIVTPMPSILEVVKHLREVYVAADSSARSLADAILAVAGDKKMAHALQQGAKDYAKNISWKSRAEKCLSFMRNTSSER